MAEREPTLPPDPIRAARDEVVRGDVRPADTATPGERPGDVIDRYKLLEAIGEGGMGAVWMAEQKEPVKRRVALKIIKLGMDTKQVVARFEAERQALAMMDHPNIAKVLDAGATSTGRPYFVMEYIKGIPILEYCDQEKVDTEARLLLFTSVCHAIQHAHQKGIIHRDIKPSNVLVTLHDGVPVCKVIDFGIAKATNSELTTKTLFTEHRQMVGTPAYMSPEQAEMSGLDIDTRSDIYSLGVLLYELLTGTTPFDMKELLAKGFAEMMRTIREDEPHKPSTRISTLGATATRTAQQRHVDLKKLGTLLRGDLDWIVMKCLEKDRTRRYETANGLAADIKRHLHDEPITAGAPSASYRLRKFVRRNKAQVVAGGFVALALVLGVIGTSIGMVRAFDQTQRADEETQRAGRAATAEAKARKRAETVGEFVVKALEASDPHNAGGRQDMTVVEAMDRAIADVDSGRFRDDAETEAKLRLTIGAILRNNGRLREAEVLLGRALETVRSLDAANVSIVVNELALVKGLLGKTEEARRLLVEALELEQRQFPGDHPAVSRALCNLGMYVPAEEARPLLDRALAMDRRIHRGDSAELAASITNMGSMLWGAGRSTEADLMFAEALQMSRRVYTGDHPFLARALDNLGKTRFSLGDQARGVELLTEALAMRRRLYKGPHPDLATGLRNLAQMHLERRSLSEAERLFAEALDVVQQVFPGDHWSVALAHASLSDVLIGLQRAAAAEVHAARALQIRRALHAGDHVDVVESLAQLGRAQADQGRAADAAATLGQAAAMVRRLAPADGQITAIHLDNLGKALQSAGLLDDAEALLAQSLAMRERVHTGDHPDLAKGLNNLAQAMAARRRFAEAEAMQRRALAMYERLFPDDAAYVAFAMDNLAVILRDAGRPAEAEPHAVKAVTAYQRAVSDDDPRIAMAWFNLGTIREALGRAPETVQAFEAALQRIQKQLPATDVNVCHCMTRLATAYYNVGAIDQAIPLFEEAMRGEVAVLGREHPDTLMTIGNVGANYATVGRHAEAVPLLEEAQRHAKQYPQLGFVTAHLIGSYGHLGDTAKAIALADQLVAEGRRTLPVGSPQLAQTLAGVGLQLITLRAWDAAEPVLREVLAIREQKEPEGWKTFNSRAQLGAVWLGQGKFAAAEPLLLAGYRGMKEREASIEPNGRERIPQALEQIVRLYEATGNATEAATWREELAKCRAARPSAAR